MNTRIRSSLYLFTFLTIAIFSTAQSKLDSILYDFHNRHDRVLVAAHRAPHATHPENSLAAVKEAIAMGIDIVELDIRETKDGVLVVIHDKTVDRTTNGKGLVSEMTYRQLRKLRLLQNGKPTNEKIPSFKEVLKLTKGQIMLDIDYKADGERAAKTTLTMLRKKNMEAQCLFFLYDYQDADALYKINSKLQFMARAYNQDDVNGILKLAMPVPVIHADDKFYNDSLMSIIRGKGKRVWMNALNKYDKMEVEKKGSGFDALLQLKHTNVIQTDLPKELLGYLRKKGLHR